MGSDSHWEGLCIRNAMVDSVSYVAIDFRWSLKYYGPSDQREAHTFCSAMIYPDSHRPCDKESQLGVGLRNHDEQRLRRFVSIGWVVRGTSKRISKTGHALVIDVEEGRNLGAWLVLASSFPNKTGDMDYDGDDNIYSPQQIARGDTSTEGVLSMDEDRLTVGKIQARVHGEGHESVFRAFGREFEFVVGGKGGMNGGREPELAGVVRWYWDPVAREDVVYTRRGEVFMRFDRETRRVI